MAGIPDFGIFRDAKGRRCIAYNCGGEHCLVIDEAGRQVFTLAAGDTNSAIIDAGQPKVRTMAAPHERGVGASGNLPARKHVWFEGQVLIGRNYQRMDRWWFLFAQIQRIPDAGDKGSSPPAAIQIVNVKGMEYFQVVVCHEAAPTGVVVGPPKMIVPRGVPFKFRFDYFDDKGGPNGWLKVTITTADGKSRVICDYRGSTGFDDFGGIYAAWGIYGASGWKTKQLPLVFTMDGLDWGFK